MKHLPLYEDTRAAIEKAELLTDTNKKCKRCKLHDTLRSVCIGADGQRPDPETGFEGAVLVLGDFPTNDEDAAARPLSLGPNGVMREVISDMFDGPVVFATALRCAPRGRNVTETMVDQCRGYTWGLIEELKPSRIICLGKHAYWSVLGSKCDSIQLGRRGYGYLSNETPVYMLHAPRRVTPNRFLFERWKKDLQWALTGELPELPPWDGTILEIETPEDAVAACADLAQSGRFAFDTETGGLMGDEYFQVVCLTATPSDNLKISYLWTEEALKDPALLEPLRQLLMDGDVLKVGHSLKYDFSASAYGLNLRGENGVLQIKGVGGDTLLWVKALDTESKGALDHADHHVGMGGHKAENKGAIDKACELIGRCRADPKQQRLVGHTHPALTAAMRHPQVDAKAFAYALVPRKILYRYCALDTVATARLDAKYRPIVMNSKPRKLLHDVLQCPPTAAIAQVESWGMSADVDAVKSFGALLKPRRDQFLQQIRAQGCQVDIGSHDQLARYLYEDLSLPVQKLTKKGKPSTDAAALKKLEGHHPVIPMLLDFAKVDKLINTYVDGLLPHIRPDGRIRSTLNIAGARSGRMSSSNPNLQNIPSGGEYAKLAKAIFNAPPGHVLLQLDYSQLEVRVAAMLSQDENLIQAYLDGVDVHRRTASMAFHVPEHDITKDQRRGAKTVVFGVLYGKSPRSLAKDLGVSDQKGQALYDSVLGGLPGLNQWMREQRAFVQKHGAIWTYVPQADGTMARARSRQLWQIAEPDSLKQSRARNGAVNTPVQGSASDFMLRSVVAAVNWIVGDGVPCRVTNTVHDSIILEVTFEWALEVAEMIKQIMEGWPSCGVPLVADVDLGMTWGSLHTLKGIKLVAQARRNNLTDAEIIHLAKADADLDEEMGKDPAKWLAKVEDLATKVAA